MTVENPWNDDLLDRLATALESSARAIQANSEAVSEIRIDYRDTTRAIFESLQRLTEVQSDIIQTITAQQMQIRGLQTENRRLTELLLRQSGNEQPNEQQGGGDQGVSP